MKPKTKIFLSHSSKDNNFVEELAKKLSADGYSVWYDEWEIKVGDSIVQKINEGISESDFLIVVLSKNSVNSKWVKEELNVSTLKNIQSNGVFILPILLDNCKIPLFLTDKKYADFSSDSKYAYGELIHAIESNISFTKYNPKQSIIESKQKSKLSFKEKVGSIYRMLNYNVEYQRIFNEKEIDIFLKGDIGDFIVYRAIKCQMGKIEQKDLDDYLITLKYAKQDFPKLQGTIVSSASFSDNIKKSAMCLDINLITFKDLSSKLINGHAYAQKLIDECESNERYPINNYIKQYIGYDTRGEDYPAFEIIEEWISDVTWNQLTLLGDLGIGKTFISRILSYQLAKNYIESSIDNPLPIRINLRKADREFSIEGLILTHLSQNGMSKTSYDVFQYALSEGNIILILDGFDEMSARVSPMVSKRNFQELAKCVQNRAKVLLTCRTHYFRSKTDEEEIILGGKNEFETEFERELYRDLISRKGFKIVYLRSFNEMQIEDYISTIMPDTAQEVIKKIRKTYNLIELSKRPLLLNMIVESIPKLKGRNINAATLYKIFTDAWIHREQWREIISPEKKFLFLIVLSYQLWQEDSESIHYSTLLAKVEHEFSNDIYKSQELLELDNEIRTATFLDRDEQGNYSFAHKSFAEYFLARYIEKGLNKRNVDILKIKPLTQEVIFFLKDNVKVDPVKKILQNILRQQYQAMISENALIILYGVLKSEAILEKKNEKNMVKLPSKMNFNNAQLEQVNLENAILLNVNFSNAKMSGAILSNAVLVKANMQNANLKDVQLNNADLTHSNLENANLKSSNLEETNLEGAILANANLQDTILVNVNFKNANLNGANGKDAFLSDEDIAHLIPLFGTKKDVEQTFLMQKLRVNQKFKSDQELVNSLLPELVFVAQKASEYITVQSSEDGVEGDGDILSLLFLKINNQSTIDHIKQIHNDINALRVYLFAIAKNIAMYGYRKKYDINKIYATTSDALDIIENIEGSYDIESKMIDKNLMEKIEREIEHLPKELSFVLKARHIKGFSFEQISKMLGVSIHVARYRSVKGMKILKSRMANYQ